MKLKVNELTLSGLLILLLALFMWANYYLMPSMVVNIISIVFIVIIMFYAAMIWSAKPQDERELLILTSANSRALMFGVVISAIGIIVETLRDRSTDWLIAILAAITISRLISHFNERKKQE